MTLKKELLYFQLRLDKCWIGKELEVIPRRGERNREVKVTPCENSDCWVRTHDDRREAAGPMSS